MRTALVVFAAICVALLVVGCMPRAPQKPAMPAPTPAPAIEPMPEPAPAEETADDYSDLIDGEDPDMGDVEDLPETDLIVP